MKTQIQVTVGQLEKIIEAHKAAVKRDSSLSDTIEIEVTRKSDLHLGGDMIGVNVKSNYAECDGTTIFWNWE